MVDKPEYLTDQPVNVKIDSLHAFAEAMQAELDTNLLPNAQVLRQQLGADQSGFTSAKPFGADPDYPEAYLIGNYHIQCVDKATDLLGKLALGIQAIAYAAHNIANDFTSSDELNHMDLAKVPGYFHPTDKSRSLAERGLPQQPGTPEA